MPRLHGALASYIANDKEFRGIGPALAARLAEIFGRRLRKVLIERDPEVIDILGHDLAETVFAAIEFRAQETELVDWLDVKGIAQTVGVRAAIRIARCWGGEGVEALKENPYLLTAFLPWKTVESVAKALAIEPDDPRRAVAAVEAVLYAHLDQNDTWVSGHNVEAGVAKLLNHGATSAGAPAVQPIEAALAGGGACRLGSGLQPVGAAFMEEAISRQIATAVHAGSYQDLLMPIPVKMDLDKRIEAFERGQQHRLTNMQKAAIRAALMNRVMVLAGYAGSGKTTTLRGICDIADSLGRQLHLMALSGRAAQRMKIATGRPARTIAGFLQSVAGPDSKPMLPGSMVIIDESSMLDLPTFWRIMKVLGEANLVLVGDPAQLPPIGFGLTFHVLCDTQQVPRVVLDRVLRQSKETGIPAVAEAVRSGILPTLPSFSGANPGVSFIECSADEALDVISEVGGILSAAGVELGETQIISPVRSGPAGIDAINRHFHRARQTGRSGDHFPGVENLAGGDPIIWTQNDWDRELMNGSMGRLHSVIDGIGHAILDGRAIDLTEADGSYLALAYAISVHKAQGSQWRRVIVPVFKSRLMDRTLLYTAITRAAEQVILIGDHSALRDAIESKPFSLQRSVGFKLRLQEALHSH